MVATTGKKAPSGAAQPAPVPDAQSGDSQPATLAPEASNSKIIPPLHLSELNERSARLGLWHVGIFQPQIDEWTWQDKNTGQQKRGAAFRCLLVSMLNPSEYVVAQQSMRNGNRAALDATLHRYRPNTAFRMTNVQFQGNAIQEYMHTPLKVVVQMQSSKFDPILNASANQVVQPQPSMTLSEVKELTKRQRFDVTALLESVSEPRKKKRKRQVRV